jgi:hypothetical protein
MDAPPPRSGECPQLGDSSRSAFLGKADEVHEHLGGRFGVRKSAVTRRRSNAEEVRERGKADAPEAAFEQATRKRGGTERRFREPATVEREELPLEEALVEAGVVSDEERVGGKGQEAGKYLGDRRCVPKLALAEAR